jgi:hypothetical protein
MLQVIGAGFGRTGTHSLGLALEKLGFDPCYNIREVAKNVDHTKLWNNALDGKSIDWSHLFKDYRASVEWPGAFFYRVLVQHFPKAKVILTLREPGLWYESASNTIFEGLELSAHNPDLLKRESGSFYRRLILQSTFENQHNNREFAINVYKEHIQQVSKIVPSEKLLRFDVRDGWEPLCDFLQKPIPEEAFPWLNERTEFMASEPEWAKQMISAKRKYDT